MASSGWSLTLGKYECRSFLSRGRYTTTYDAWDPDIDRRVAIKVLPLPVAAPGGVDGQQRLTHFKREIQAVGHLSQALSR
jgi:serine/threonine protein kinase